MTTEPKPRRPDVLLNPDQLAVIDRAIRLQHALDGNMDAPTQISDGAALAGIVQEWLERVSGSLAIYRGVQDRKEGA